MPQPFRSAFSANLIPLAAGLLVLAVASRFIFPRLVAIACALVVGVAGLLIVAINWRLMWLAFHGAWAPRPMPFFGGLLLMGLAPILPLSAELGPLLIMAIDPGLFAGLWLYPLVRLLPRGRAILRRASRDRPPWGVGAAIYMPTDNSSRA